MIAHAMRRGFTIVEMLVTIGIIALLMGLLMGGISKARGAARASREASDL
ncbi:MAG: type II secretion system protein, partial [Planctomycetota bacterium]